MQYFKTGGFMKDLWVEHNDKIYNLNKCTLILKGIYQEYPAIVLLFHEQLSSTLTFEDKNERNDYFEYLKDLLTCDDECDNIA